MLCRRRHNSWDITKLKGPAAWSYFHLYSIIDIYSRYTVGWMVATRESAQLAERLLFDTIAKQGIHRDQLTIHSDNGSSMASKPVAFLLADLGVATHIYEHSDMDGIAFTSRLGDDLRLWAIFEQAGDPAVSPRLARIAHHGMTAESAEIHEVFELFGLSWH